MNEKQSKYPDRRERKSSNDLEKIFPETENPEIQKTTASEATIKGVSGFMESSDTNPDFQVIRALVDELSEERVEENEERGFPLDALPPEALGIVEEFKQQTQGQINPALPAVFSLAAISAATIPRLELKLPDGRRDGSNIYILCGSPSSSGKTRVVDGLFEPLTKRDATIAQEHLENVLPGLEAEKDLLEAELGRLISEQKNKKNTESCSQENHRRIVEIKKRLYEIDRQKICPRFWIQDTSETAIVKALDSLKKKVLTLKDCDARKTIRTMCEGIAVSGHSEEDKWIKGWDRTDMFLDRSMGGHGKGNGYQAQIRKPTISMALAVQPDKIRELSQSTDLFESGMFQRLLICIAESDPLLERDEAHSCGLARSNWTKLIDALLDAFRCYDSEPVKVNAGEEDSYVVVQLSGEALRAWIKFQNLVAGFQKKLRGANSIALKWAQNNNRIALLLHAAEYKGQAGKYEISLNTMMKAIRITCWFARQQLEIFRPVREAIENKDMEKLVAALGKKDRYDNQTATFAQLKANHGITKDQCYRAKQSHPNLFEIIEPTNSGPGRPSTPKIRLIGKLK